MTDPLAHQALVDDVEQDLTGNAVKVLAPSNAFVPHHVHSKRNTAGGLLSIAVCGIGVLHLARLINSARRNPYGPDTEPSSVTRSRESHKTFVESFGVDMCLMCCRLGFGRTAAWSGYGGAWAIWSTILDRGGDYCLALKGNQPALFEDVRLWLDDPATPVTDVCQTVDGDHGRIETRRAIVVHDVAWLTERHDFPGLAAVAKVTATREIDGKSTTAERYDLLSKPLAAGRLAQVVRTHWHIENCLHWVLDVVMDEDRSRARKDHAPDNLARLRRFALNLLRANRDQGSTRGKIKPAARNDAFLLQILTAA